MVSTGNRAAALKAMLEAIGYRTAERAPSPRVPDLTPEHQQLVDTIYRSLGGVDPAPKFRPGPWDLTFEGGLIVELDEELHFNRYRHITLQPDGMAALPWRNDYLRHTVEHEAACLAGGRWGKRWTNPSCERMFGPASEPGTLDQGGAPRWKQRALYDCIKDLTALDRSDIRLVRLATHDLIDTQPLGEALQGNGRIDLEALRCLVDERSN